MFLHYIGHAGWLFEEDGHTVLCDPWQGKHGAFYASWFPFPANEHVQLPTEVDAIYVSHAHQDHFCAETLSRFSRRVPIIIAKFDDPVLREELAALGFSDIRALDDGECQRTGPFSLQIFRDEDCGMYHDSALLVRTATASVLNLNDCRLSEQWLSEIDRPDVLLGQFSGANWYPSVYEYPEETKHQLGAAKRRRGLDRLANNARRCRAKVTVPCAGPPAFLDSRLRYLNDARSEESNQFPMMDTAVRFLCQQGHPAFLAMPGDILAARDGALTLEARTLPEGDVYGDRAAYLQAYAERKHPAIQDYLNRLELDIDVGALLKQELERVAESSQVFAGQIQGPIRFQLPGVAGGDLVLDCTHAARNVRIFHEEPVSYRFTIDPALVSDLLRKKHINFEDVFLSMRFSAWRTPDIFDTALFALLVNFDADRLRRCEENYVSAGSRPVEGTFEVVHQGERYAVQRSCPHMNGDLSQVGVVSNGVITCARHGWQFRLTDGACLNVSAPPIAVRKLGRQAAAQSR